MKRVFITGGSRGLGEACVRLFAARGWEVVFTYCRSAQRAEELCRRLPNVSARFCDLADSRAVFRLGEESGRFDAVVNNAGESLFGLFQDLSAEEAERFFRVDFLSAFHLLRGLCPKMIARGSGAVVNVASIWGQCGASCEALYSSAKAALIGLTKALALELAPSGIRVNAVSPGVIDTDMNARFTGEELEEIRASIPLGRFAAPEEIAEIVYFLAGEESGYLTAQVLSPNGGQWMG